jgi:hypothetical protein
MLAGRKMLGRSMDARKRSGTDEVRNGSEFEGGRDHSGIDEGKIDGRDVEEEEEVENFREGPISEDLKGTKGTLDRIEFRANSEEQRFLKSENAIRGGIGFRQIGGDEQGGVIEFSEEGRRSGIEFRAKRRNGEDDIEWSGMEDDDREWMSKVSVEGVPGTSARVLPEGDHGVRGGLPPYVAEPREENQGARERVLSECEAREGTCPRLGQVNEGCIPECRVEREFPAKGCKQVGQPGSGHQVTEGCALACMFEREFLAKGCEQVTRPGSDQDQTVRERTGKDTA